MKNIGQQYKCVLTTKAVSTFSEKSWDHQYSDIVPILSSLTGGPPGKGGGQQDKNDGGALNFDPGYTEKKVEQYKLKGNMGY